MIKLKFLMLFFIGLVSSSSNLAFDSPDKEISILFIGNSLTYTNNLPNLIKKVAIQKGITIKTKTMAFPDYALIDHWNDGNIQKEIGKKQYDFVVVQQGPSSQPYGRELLIEYGKKINDLCIKNDSKLCYFMVWPSQTYYHTFNGVIKSYTDAATNDNAILLPVGKVWKDHFDTTRNFDYYGFDGFHPSKKGSQIAAEIIVDCMLKVKTKSHKNTP